MTDKAFRTKHIQDHYIKNVCFRGIIEKRCEEILEDDNSEMINKEYSAHGPTQPLIAYSVDRFPETLRVSFDDSVEYHAFGQWVFVTSIEGVFKKFRPSPLGDLA